MITLRRFALVAVLATLAGCRPGAPELVRGDDPKHPRVRYTDGLVTCNDRCPVKRNALNPRMVPLYANGRPVGFC